MAKKVIIAGTPRKNDFILRFKPYNMYHRVPAKNLDEAKQKFLKGTRFKKSDIMVYKGKKRRR